MKVFFHNDCLLHDPPYEILSGRVVPYFETPDRLKFIKKALLEQPHNFELTDNLDQDIDILQHILNVHEAEYLTYLEGAYETWVAGGGSPDAVLPDTFSHISLLSNRPDPSKLSPIAKAGLYCFDLSCPITKDTYRASLMSVHVVLTAIKHLTTLKPGEGTFALCRPPGHHSSFALSGGYCYLNNVAIAAKYLQNISSKGTTIGILDIDYHHGNGSQQIFYRDPSVFYVSLHAKDDYPYLTGSSDETGDGPGEGFNLNFPLPKSKTGNDEYCAALTQAIDALRSFNPSFIIVSLGVDTHIEDPISDFKITTEGYLRIGGLIATLGKPTLFVMEGGYHLESIGYNVRNVLSGFQKTS